MPKSRNESRLDEIEVELTPKEWAIKLADEIRSYPNAHDFLCAIAEGTYHKSPYIRPYLALAKQAEVRYPGKNAEDLKASFQLNRKLRTEYHSLKMLINNINDEFEIKVDNYLLRTRALTNQLHSLILRDVFAQVSAKSTALIDQRGVTEPTNNEWRMTAKELADVALAAGSPACLFSLAREWADEAGTLLMEIFAHKAAVLIVQQRRFDDHAVLHPSIADALESTLETILENVAIFNQYLDTKARDLAQTPPAGGVPVAEQKMNSLRVDADLIDEEGKKFLAQGVATAWENRSKNKAIADILEESGEHRDFIWQRFQEEFGVEA